MSQFMYMQMFEFDEKRYKEGLMKDALTPNQNSEGGTRECQKEKTQTKVVFQKVTQESQKKV